jgi:hypothetical protein
LLPPPTQPTNSTRPLTPRSSNFELTVPSSPATQNFLFDASVFQFFAKAKSLWFPEIGAFFQVLEVSVCKRESFFHGFIVFVFVFLILQKNFCCSFFYFLFWFLLITISA